MADEKEEAVRLRAYAIWKEEGCPHGHDLRHWLQAKEEMASVDHKDNLPAANGKKKAVVVPAAA